MENEKTAVPEEPKEEKAKKLTRAEVEASRGIFRNEGQVIRTKEWIKERIILLKAKEQDCHTRLKNIKEELVLRQKELADPDEMKMRDLMVTQAKKKLGIEEPEKKEEAPAPAEGEASKEA